MDRLENKSYKQYDYVSRYTPFPTYYNTLDDKYIYGITDHLNKDISYMIHKVSDYDTLELLANAYYGRPDFYWILADFNDIVDPFIVLKEKYSTLKIPNMTKLYFGD